MMDGNEAAARVAYQTSEVVALYPITPASPMGELADQWSSTGRTNLWGQVPRVVEMQSEGGAAGAVHGALQAGALTTTFTASQGLLLMIPNLYKVAGELTCAVIHVAARSLAAQALSIFGDHSDVMAARGTGVAMLFSSSVQEVQDQALIALMASLDCRLPFLHVFDGFRTSHQLDGIVPLPFELVASLVDAEQVREHRQRGLTPEHPVVRGTAQNPDVFFQARETVNPFYDEAPGRVQRAMDRFAEKTGRRYALFEYRGHPEAERVLVLMGSGAETAFETVDALAAAGERVGAVKVRLFRPFSSPDLNRAIPASARTVAVLDRTKEPGATGEPLYQDVLSSLVGLGRDVRVVGGRYGLSSKEFTPAMVRAVLQAEPRHSFTVGIRDDVTSRSLPLDPDFILEDPESVRAIFWGLGSDGTVGANKSSIKIIGEETDLYAQGYFVYDSKKAGARTISHLRFGPRPVSRPYLIQRASFVAVHQFDFLERYDVLELAQPGAVFLLNSPYPAAEVWDYLPREIQSAVLEKKLQFHVVDASRVAREAGLGGRINTVMQTCFFALSGVLPLDEAVIRIQREIEKNYGRRGEEVLQRNFAAVDMALRHLERVDTSAREVRGTPLPPTVPESAPDFVRTVTAPLMAGRGDDLPVSALPADGTYPCGTARWERRNLAAEVPVWEPDLCIQCGKCVLVCPHAVIRARLVEPSALEGAPEGFKHHRSLFRELPDHRYTLQVAVEDCTGCALCVDACPAKDKSHAGRKALNMAEQRPLREPGARDWDYFLTLPDHPDLRYHGVKDVQLLEPLFEFSGACAGCGETPYLKLLSQLFGDRAIVANATGCSSIYGGNLPTTPWSANRAGRGPAWSNSLFEDNAEFALGIRLGLDQQTAYARQLMAELEVTDLAQLQGRSDPKARDLLALHDLLSGRSVWAVGGDGWAYDIGFGGLDHVLASGADVNILVLDTEVYSNTGGQASKATPLGAVAKFAAGGRPQPKKDLGMMAMSYGNVYVAQVAMGANDTQTVRAFREAEAWPGTSLILAYSHCIAHGIDMGCGLRQQKLAVETGQWLLYRFDPRLGLQLDCKEPSRPLKDYLDSEGRFRMLRQTHPDAARHYAEQAQEWVLRRWKRYVELAGGTA
ncbi:MAG: pyruvate:ferredoxin (flavodoxin) oxidoreductase [Candidatus Eremiobacterota bacterium]